MTTVDLTAHAVPGASPGLSGYLATPPGPGPWPGLVVLHGAQGVDEATRAHTDRLAGMGYLSLAVDLFSAGNRARCLVTTMRAMLRGEGRPLADIESARQHLLGEPACTGTIGTIGFCLGGGFALLCARSGYAAASVNYGRLPADLGPALARGCPIVASYGGRDRGLRGAAAKLESALTAAGVPHDVKEYPLAGHAFLDETESGPAALRPLLRVAGVGPDPVSAADAWVRIEEFFAAYLAGGDHVAG